MEEEVEDAIASGNEEFDYLINNTTTTTTSTSTITDIDQALEQCGPFGRFQFLMQVFFMAIVFGSAYQSVSSYFIGSNIPWTCTSTNTSTFCQENFGVEITSHDVNFTRRCSMERNAWRYTQPKTTSYVSQFDLVCNKKGVNAIVGAAFFIGAAIAVLPASAIADMYGRKLVLSGATIVYLVSSICCSFVTAVWQLVFLRALIGSAEGQICNVAYVYLVEFMPASKRASSLNLFQIAFIVCGYFLVGLAYIERDWRKLNLYLSFPIILPLILFMLVPESPRWLLACGRRAEAEKIVHRISRVNGKPLYNLELTQVTGADGHQTTRKKCTYLDLFRNCKVFVLVLALGFCWYSIALLFFGVTFEAQNLGSNIYESFSFIAIPDMPCCIIALWLCQYCGRRKVIALSFLLAGIFIGAIAIFVTNVHVGLGINIIFAICGKVFMNIIYNVMFLWTFELFPTVIRTQGSGICLLLSRFGAATAPFLSDVFQTIDPRLSYVFMGVMGLLSCVAALFLCETKDLPLREQYNDFFTSPTKVVLENELADDE